MSSFPLSGRVARGPRVRQRRTVKQLLVVLIVFCCVFAGQATAQREEGVHALIQRVAAIADKIVVDGKGADWEGIPSFDDSAVDGRGGGDKDIVSASIAPRTDDLLIRIQTAEKPSGDDLAYWVNIDLVGSPSPDFILGIVPGGVSRLWLHTKQDAERYKAAAGVEAAVDEIVEVRVPYDDLRQLLPLEMRRLLGGAEARTWVRVVPMAWDAGQERYVDEGPAVASYRLTPMHSLDPPLPRSDRKPLAIRPPFQGQWFVMQGAFGEQTHKDQWAYDFEVLDDTLRATRRGGHSNEDHLSWDQRVLSPSSARVLRTDNDAADHDPHVKVESSEPVNGVYIELNSESGLWLGHMRQGSVAVRKGQYVGSGTELGRVGNSGWSNRPHLHIALYRLPTGTQSAPLAFSNVVVRLNHTEDDPWARHLEEWPIHEGYFVQAR